MRCDVAGYSLNWSRIRLRARESLCNAAASLQPTAMRMDDNRRTWRRLQHVTDSTSAERFGQS